MSYSKLFYSILLPAVFFICLSGFAQDRVVTGVVTDSTGSGVGNVTVTAKGSHVATQTSSAGAFRLSVPATSNILVFTSVGFSTREEVIPPSNILNVSLA